MQDELDLETGKLTQRIGEVELANREWIKAAADFNVPIYGTKINNLYFTNDVISMCDKLSTISYTNRFNINIGQYYTTAEYIYIGYNDVSVSEFKSYIDNLSPKLQYQFKTPTTKTVDLSIVDQENKTVKAIKTHPTLTHISTSSQGLIPNIVIPSQIKYPTIIKPSTTYSVQLKQTTANS